MRRRMRPTPRCGVVLVVAAAVILGLNAIVADATEAPNNLQWWADHCAQNHKDCANRLLYQHGPGPSSAAGDALKQRKDQCLHHPDDCAIALYQREHPGSPGAPSDALDCVGYTDDCAIRLYNIERQKGAHDHNLKSWVETCSLNPADCTNRLYASEHPQSPGAGTTPPTAPAPAAPAPGVSSPTAPEGRSAPAKLAPPPKDIPKSNPPSSPLEPNQPWHKIEVAAIVIAIVFLLFVVVWLPVAFSNWIRSVFANRIRGVTKWIPGKIADSTDVDIQHLLERDRARQSQIRDLRRHIENLEDEIVLYRGLRERVADLERIVKAFPAANRQYEAPPEQNYSSENKGEESGSFISKGSGGRADSVQDPPIRALLSEYDDAIRGDPSTVEPFTDKWGVFGLAKSDGESPNGRAVLAAASETDPQQWRFWAITNPNGVTAVLPGRYLYLHASSTSADGGRAGDRTYGQVFKIVLGSDFKLRQYAKARKTTRGFEIDEQGELELAGSSSAS